MNKQEQLQQLKSQREALDKEIAELEKELEPKPYFKECSCSCIECFNNIPKRLL